MSLSLIDYLSLFFLVFLGTPVAVNGALGNADYPIVYFAPIHPAGLVGLESPPDVLAIARNTLWAVSVLC